MVAMNRPVGVKRASPAPDELVGRVKAGASELARATKGGARSATAQLARAAGEMTRTLTETAKTEADRLYERQRGRAVSNVARAGKVAHQTAHAMRAVQADQLAGYADEAGRRMEQLSDYLERRTWGQLLADADELIRRHEALAVGALFVAGFALARFAKAGAAHREAEQADAAAAADADAAEAHEPRRRRGGGGKRRRSGR